MEQFKEIFEQGFIRNIQHNDGEIYLVGGCVRDYFLSKEPKDIDLIVRGIPATELQMFLNKFGTVKLVGESFGVFKFTPFDTNEEYDIALPRKDKKIEGAKGHKSIEAQSDCRLRIEDDLARRDFTINAIAIDKDFQVIDPFDGQEDLYKGIIRCVSEDTFVDDPLRLIRAVQFAARFNFELSEETINLIQQNKQLIREETAERILMEFRKVFEKNGNIHYFAELLHDTGLFEEYFGMRLKHKRLSVCQHLSELLFFGVSDATFMVSDFYKKKLGSAIDQNLFKEIRAFDTLYNAKMETVEDGYMAMFEAAKQSDVIFTSNFIQDYLCGPFITGEFPRRRADLAITGDDLAEMGFKQGSIIGAILNDCLRSIFSKKVRNTRKELITIVEQYSQGIPN